MLLMEGADSHQPEKRFNSSRHKVSVCTRRGRARKFPKCWQGDSEWISPRESLRLPTLSEGQGGHRWAKFKVLRTLALLSCYFHA